VRTLPSTVSLNIHGNVIEHHVTVDFSFQIQMN
jgi:hypothetical protein